MLMKQFIFIICFFFLTTIDIKYNQKSFFVYTDDKNDEKTKENFKQALDITLNYVKEEDKTRFKHLVDILFYEKNNDRRYNKYELIESLLGLLKVNVLNLYIYHSHFKVLTFFLLIIYKNFTYINANNYESYILSNMGKLDLKILFDKMKEDDLKNSTKQTYYDDSVSEEDMFDNESFRNRFHRNRSFSDSIFNSSSTHDSFYSSPFTNYSNFHKKVKDKNNRALKNVSFGIRFGTDKKWLDNINTKIKYGQQKDQDDDLYGCQPESDKKLIFDNNMYLTGYSSDLSSRLKPRNMFFTFLLSCSVTNKGSGNDTMNCVEKKLSAYNLKLSDTCSQCFKKSVVCGRLHCWFRCFFKSPCNPDCQKCGMANCQQDLITCSGLSELPTACV